MAGERKDIGFNMWKDDTLPECDNETIIKKDAAIKESLQKIALKHGLKAGATQEEITEVVRKSQAKERGLPENTTLEDITTFDIAKFNKNYEDPLK